MHYGSPLCREALGRQPDADLSTGPDGKRMQSRVQLVRGVEGAYMIGAISFSQAVAPGKLRPGNGERGSMSEVAANISAMMQELGAWQ